MQLSTRIVDLDISVRSSFNHGLRNARIVEGSNFLGIKVIVKDVIMKDSSIASFCSSNHRDTAQDWIVGKVLNERRFNVKAILRKHNGGLPRRYSRSDQVGRTSRNILNIFGGDENVLKWGEVFFRDIRNGLPY